MTNDEYCLYLRKSRTDLEAEARGEGETLKRHETILLDLARKMNIYIKKENIYREVISGETISSRPVMQHVLAEVEQAKWKGVFVVEVERLARGDTIDQGLVAQAFKYTNTKIITPMKIYDPSNEFDEEYFEFGLFMSRREYKTINRRLQQGRIQSVKEGKYLGTVAPYGYSRVKLKDQKGYTLEILSNESKIVELIYDLYTRSSRIGVSLIVRKLNEMKVPTRKGGDWTTSTIRGILSNPVYVGKIRWNSRPEVKKVVDGEIVVERPRANEQDWILVGGLHPAIIKDVIYNLAQEYLADNPAAPVPNRHKIMNPLAGLITCGLCGRKMNRRPYGGRQEETLMCPVTSCNNISSKLSLVEDKLIKSLELWLHEYKLDLASKQNTPLNENVELGLLEKAIKKINEDIKILEKQLSSLHDFLEQGIYSTEIFIERSQIINNKINDSTEDKTKIEENLNDYSNTQEVKRIFIPKVEKVIGLYFETVEPRERNELLKEVLDKAVYTKTVNSRWHGSPDDFTIVLYPKLLK